MNFENPPENYWHCLVKLPGNKKSSVINDLSFLDLERMIVQPWRRGSPFTISGAVVNPTVGVPEIRIVHTEHPQKTYADRHNVRMKNSNISDFATDRRLLPFANGFDATFDLLFAGGVGTPKEPDINLVIRVCERLPQTAKILTNRTRKGKASYKIEDEYDVQDLLHATLRAYFKYPVQEDTLPKVASAKSGRIDISIEELGVLIEVKYVRSPLDQKRLFEELSQDLLLYSRWPHLKTMVYLIYNSGDLRDAEAFEKLSAPQEIGGKKFELNIVLA